MTYNYTPALLCVDIQKGLDETDYYGGNRNNPQAEENIERIIQFWRSSQWPIYHVKHNSTESASPLRPGMPGNNFKDCATPLNNEPVFQKTVNSAFIGTDLNEKLIEDGISVLVIIGLTTEHCISTTTRMSGNLGFRTYLISDATAAFDKITTKGKVIPADTVHEVELSILDGEFCKVVDTENLIQLLKSIS